MEFRKMRRAKQLISEEEAIRILEEGTDCVLGLIGDEGYPYAVPVNYAYSEGRIYIHGATSGHKFDALRANDKVSLCVISRNAVVPEELTTAYRSVIVFGRARMLKDPEQIIRACQIIGLKFNPDAEFVSKHAVDAVNRTCCIEVQIEQITGKEGMVLARQRNQ